MDWSQYQGLGWATAVAVVAIAAVAAVCRRWRKKDAIQSEYDELKKKYAKAVDDCDLDLAASIAGRMQKLEKQL